MGKPAVLRPKPKRASFTTVGENRWISCKVACCGVPWESAPETSRFELMKAKPESASVDLLRE